MGALTLDTPSSDGDPDTVEVDIDISGEFEANGMRVPFTASDLGFPHLRGSHSHPTRTLTTSTLPLDIPVDVYACPWHPKEYYLTAPQVSSQRICGWRSRGGAAACAASVASVARMTTLPSSNRRLISARHSGSY